jgi:hypothetical protein
MTNLGKPLEVSEWWQHVGFVRRPSDSKAVGLRDRAVANVSGQLIAGETCVYVRKFQ